MERISARVTEGEVSDLHRWRSCLSRGLRWAAWVRGPPERTRRSHGRRLRKHTPLGRRRFRSRRLHPEADPVRWS